MQADYQSRCGLKQWMNYAVYTLNRTETRSKKEISSSELWLKRKPNLMNLRIFEEEIYIHIPKEKRRKWDVKAKKGFFVGYDENTKGYRFWLPERNQVKIYRCCVYRSAVKHHLVEKLKSTKPAVISFNCYTDDAADPVEIEQRPIQDTRFSTIY